MAENCVFVIFGASGDLAGKKLIPALIELFSIGAISENTVVLGTGRTDMSDNDFRKSLPEKFRGRFFYQQINTRDVNDYSKLKDRIEELDRSFFTAGRFVFYMAVPPGMYENIIEGLGSCGLNTAEDPKSYRRIVVEKPFGRSFITARELNIKIHDYFSEEQIYRIDHYLGKETVQNIMAFRFANGIFEPLWNRNYISRIEITSTETAGIEKRGGYYESSGALRDMVQNHLLQLTAVAAMEPPSSFTPEAVRTETMKIFQALRKYSGEEINENIVLGQYVSSTIKDREVPGYRDEENITPDSRTETFAALRIYIDNWRWGGVPFYIRTGKRMPARVSEIVVYFRPTPHRLFKNTDDDSFTENILIMRIQPDEGVLLTFGMKKPGGGYEIIKREMDFKYADLGEKKIPDAYERLISDVITGDSTLFTRADSVEECWKFIDPVIEYKKDKNNCAVHGYPAGTWGPEEADRLVTETSRGWRSPCKNLTEAGTYCEL